MNIRILTATDYLQRHLPSITQGWVHSVYRKTINLQFGSLLFALQTDQSPISPVSLITSLAESDFAALPVKEGDPVIVSEGSLYISAADTTCRFVLSDCVIVNTFLTTQLEQHAAVLIQQAIDHSHTGGFRNLFVTGNTIIPDAEFLILPAAGNILDECRKLVKKKSYTDAAISLSGLIGIGIGLTPSGDDFLCGVLAGFTLWNASAHPLFLQLKQAISESLNRTNDISCTFLRCALDGYFSAAINQLPKLLSDTDLRSAFEAIGHSSGMDTLSGILFAGELLY